MINQKILDSILHQFIGLERLAGGAIDRFLPLLQEIDERLIGAYSVSYGGSLGAQRKFINKVKELKTLAYANFEKEFTKELIELATNQSQLMSGMFSGYFGKSLANSPGQAAVDKIINSEIRGFTMSQWIIGLKNSDISKYVATAKTAVLDGLTLEHAIDSLERLHVRRDHKTKALVKTLITGFANKANVAVFRENKTLIKGFKLVVTFDSKTTPICIQHSADDILYTFDNYLVPPFHVGCRTILVPVTYSWQELGARNRRKVPVGTRQSMDGGTPITNTYPKWLKGQSKEIQDDVLGKTFGRMFRTGKYKLTRFIDPTGKLYTIKELFKIT